MPEEFVKWYALNLNPEQWRVGPLGWKNVNGRRIQVPGPDPELQNYQAAVREELGIIVATDGTQPYDGLVEFRFYFWKRLDAYETSKKKSRRHEADATNLQKALEDALQGVLITNDRNVRRIRSEIVEQSVDTIPAIVIRFSAYQPEPVELPVNVVQAIGKFGEEPCVNFDNTL